MLGSGVAQMGRQPVQLGDIPPSLQQPFSPFMPGQDYTGGAAPSGGGAASPKPGVGTAATGLSTQDARSSGGGQPFASAGLTAPHTPVAPPARPDMRPDIDPNMSVEDRKLLYTPSGQQPTELHTNKVDGGVVIDGKYGTGSSAPIGSQGFKDYARYSDPNRPAGAMPKNMGPASQYAGMSAPPQTGPAQTGPAQLATNQPTAQAFAQDAFKASPGAMNVSQSAAKAPSTGGPAAQALADFNKANPNVMTGAAGIAQTDALAQQRRTLTPMPSTAAAAPAPAPTTPAFGTAPSTPSFTPPMKTVPGQAPAMGGAPPAGVAAAAKPPATTTPSIKPTPGAAPMKVNHSMS